MKRILLLLSIVFCSFASRSQVYAHLEMQDDYEVEEGYWREGNSKLRGTFLVSFYADQQMTQPIVPNSAITVLLGLGPNRTVAYFPDGMNQNGRYDIPSGDESSVMIASDVAYYERHWLYGEPDIYIRYDLQLLPGSGYIVIP
ncbi:hypothetical protein [Pedobacter caeni]|uniref:Uncharacterized protein n=1 Tax=Pedobacter caeni TaxID=288992 RepID=A0A1M5EQ04_9SPHI|nr:hypothetical protein [Pedobacter caeni]SHF81299.1 hypothetical protein SAMN04488522_103741 [Pedobacter caeni]